MDGWQCPDCGREFARANQWHSCLRSTVETHFKDRDPILRETYDELIRKLEAIGRLQVDAVKTSIILGSHAHFAIVYPCQRHLVLEFLADHKIQSERIYRSQALGTARVSYFVKLVEPADVDDELLNWLAQSYSLQS